MTINGQETIINSHKLNRFDCFLFLVARVGENRSEFPPINSHLSSPLVIQNVCVWLAGLLTVIDTQQNELDFSLQNRTLGRLRACIPILDSIGRIESKLAQLLFVNFSGVRLEVCSKELDYFRVNREPKILIRPLCPFRPWGSRDSGGFESRWHPFEV